LEEACRLTFASANAPVASLFQSETLGGASLSVFISHVMRPVLLIAFLIAGCFTAMSQTNEPPKKSPAELMREMRLKQLTMAPSEFSQKPTAEFPRVCAVLMDWPIEEGQLQLSHAPQATQRYTDGTFGVFGGIGTSLFAEPPRIASPLPRDILSPPPRRRIILTRSPVAFDFILWAMTESE